jgi:protein TonB
MVSSLESTLPPTSSEDLLAAAGTSALVFSHDAALASIIKRVADGRYPLRVINEWQDLIRLVKADVGRIVLLDVDALTRPVDKALAELNHSAEWLVIVIAAKQHEAQDFMRFWSERKIHRLLIKPAALGITRLLFESAVARYLELRELHEETDSLEIPPGLRNYGEKKGLKLLHAGPAAAVVLAILGGVLYATGNLPFFSTDDGGSVTSGSSVAADVNVRPPANRAELDAPQAADTTPPTAPSVAPIPAIDPFRDLVAAAGRAELAGRLTAPVGDNALDYYLEILSDAPTHAAVREKLDRLLEQLYMQAEAEFLDGDLDGAEQTLDHIQRADAASSRLRFLREQLVQARETAETLAAAQAATLAAEAAAAAAAARASSPPPVQAPVAVPESRPPARTNAELASMLTLVERRLEQNQLITPEGDSARDYLQRAVSLDPNHAEVTAAVARLRAMLVAAAEAAFAAGELADADTLVSAAHEFGPMTAELDRLRVSILNAQLEQIERVLAQLAAQTAERIEQGRLVGGEDSAAALLAQLRMRDATYAPIGRLEAELGAAVTSATRTAIAAGNWSRAEALLSGMSDAALDPQGAAVLRLELDRQSRQATYLAAPVPVGELELLRAANAEYPRAALQLGTTGWVELDFTVDAEGQTRDIVVVEAEPPGVFDDAAATAVGRYRFAPFEQDGTVYERRARVRLRFVLE